MDTRPTTGGGHSADVRIALAVNGHVFSVAKLGPGFVVLRNPVAHPPAEAELTLSIDGYERRWRVELIDGIVPGGGDTRFRNRSEHVNGAAGQ
ncbi:MAG: hypothetical protein J2P46_05455 [Zavarzinella sp.]|nr:hypothetical protein [Zavarzinella sp.]